MPAEQLDSALEKVVTLAAEAAPLLAKTHPRERAHALTVVADALEAASPELVEIAMRETGLTEVRLTGELRRTAVQLRLFAETVLTGDYLDARLDASDPNFVLGTRPDIRRFLSAVGPVINFAASNFPFAFSVPGGDTASALAAGCPVIVKVNAGHPELSRAVAEVMNTALRAAGMPDGCLQLIEGREAGVNLLKDGRVRAATFTGSIAVGRMLADIAAARPAPIPFFGELGSLNPVFLTQAAVAENAHSIATGFVNSVAGSAGQLCTKPGFVFAPVGHGFESKIASAVEPLAEHRMLNPRIAQSYVHGVSRYSPPRAFARWQKAEFASTAKDTAGHGQPSLQSHSTS